MNVIRVKNWRKRQRYEGNAPSWIKIFRDLLNPVRQPEYARLSDAAKLHLLHVWLIAAECDGDIPATWINTERLNVKGKVRLQELCDAGFLSVIDTDNQTVIKEGDLSVTPSISDSDSNSPLFDVEKVFSLVWAEISAVKVPKPVRKSLSRRHFAASVASVEDVELLAKAVTNYRASERVKRGYVQDASTFFNNWREWIDDPDAVPASVIDHPGAAIDALREWARDRKAALRQSVWPYQDSRDDFEAWLTWLNSRGGTLTDDDGTLNTVERWRETQRVSA